MTLQEALDYEICSSTIAPFITNPWLQRLAGKYFANKAIRKYNRYKRSLAIREALDKTCEKTNIHQIL